MVVKEVCQEATEVLNEFRTKYDFLGDAHQLGSVWSAIAGAMAVEIVSLRARLKAAQVDYVDRVAQL